MPPAINAAKQAKVPFHIHEYLHDPKAESYGEEAAVEGQSRRFHRVELFSAAISPVAPWRR